MKRRYLVTITTHHGTKHYTFHQIIKYILLFLLFLALSSLLGGYLYIHFLQGKISTIQREKRALEKRADLLERRVQKLNLSILRKRKRLEELSSKMADLETKMGLKGEVVYKNIDIKKLDAIHIDTCLRFIPSGSPVKVVRITAPFGWRIHPILKRREFHPGIDLGGKGEQPIFATADGIVTKAGYNRYGYGRVVKLSHIFGFSTLYAHLRKLLVKEGEYVHKGDVLGYMGSSGLSTGQHLHYEVRFDGKPFNPYPFMKWSGENFYKLFYKERRIPWESLVEGVKNILSQKRPPSSPQTPK